MPRASWGGGGRAGDDTLRPEGIRYLNRLSDLLFVLARLANARAGVADVPWEGRKRAADA